MTDEKYPKIVASFKSNFQRIFASISSFSTKDRIDRYCQEVQVSTWEEIYTKDYTALLVVISNAERKKPAQHRLFLFKCTLGALEKSLVENQKGPAWIDVGHVQLSKLTKEERVECLKTYLCLNGIIRNNLI